MTLAVRFKNCLVRVWAMSSRPNSRNGIKSSSLRGLAFSSAVRIRAGGDRAQTLELGTSLYLILQILSPHAFEKMPILCALQSIGLGAEFAENVDQLILFEF
jgi:hypothetical protein